MAKNVYLDPIRPKNGYVDPFNPPDPDNIGGGSNGGTVSFGTTAGTAAQGNDARIVGSLQKAANLSDLQSVSLARTNLGLGTAALLAATALAPVSHGHTTTDISNFDASTRAIVGTMIQGAGGTYDAQAGTITLPVSGGGTVTYGTTAGTAAQGNDSRIVNALSTTAAAATYAPIAHTQAASTISDSTAAGRALLTAADAAAQRTSLGLGTAATTAASAYAAASHNQAASTISDSTAAGRALLTATDAGAQRTALGLGTAALANTGAFAPVSHTQASSTISDSTTAGRALLTAASAADQRTALGLGPLATQSPSGTANATTVLHGDNQWKVPASAVSLSPVFAVHGSSDFPAVGDGVADDSAALNTARDSGKVIVPKLGAEYVIDGHVPRDGMVIDAFATKEYQGQNKDNNPYLPKFIKKAGSTQDMFKIDGKRSFAFRNFMVDGVDRASRAFGGGGQLGSFHGLTIVRCNSGIGGGGTIDPTYTRTCEMFMNTITDCNIGYDHLIDSNIIGGAVTSCLTGIRIVSGSNSNNWIALRVEWCTQFGWDIYESDSNQIIGGLTDRCGWAGMHIAGMNGMLSVSNHMFRRNGKENSETKSKCNLYFNINTDSKAKIIVTGCTSHRDAGDANSGDTLVTPTWSVGFGGTNTGIILSANDFSEKDSSETNSYTGTLPSAPEMLVSVTRGIPSQDVSVVTFQ